MFFKEFPIIPYQFNINGKNTLRMVRDITKGIKLSKELLDKLDYYSEYDIVDGETLERIAEKIYGNANYHWLLMVANDKFDYTKDFPLSNDTLLEFVSSKYGIGNENEQHLLFGRPHFQTQQGNNIFGYNVSSVYVKNSGNGYPPNAEIEFVDSEWELSFSESFGNVPKTNYLEPNTVFSSTGSAELIGVWDSILNAPSLGGSVMPKSGWVKIKTKNGNFTSGQTLTILNAGSVESVEILDGGEGYVQGTPVVFSPSPDGSTATGLINVSDGEITSVTILNKGSGYITSPTVTVSGGNGGAAFYAKTDNASVVLNANEKSTEPESRIKAKATLVIENGSIKQVVVVDPGSDYLNPPEYRLSYTTSNPAELNIVYPELIRITNYEYEFKLNESKRKIKIINPRIINQVADELKEII